MTSPNANDNTVRWEHRVLAAVAESLDNWDAVSVLRPDDFSLSEHQQIFAGLSRLAARGEQCDPGAWAAELGDHLAATLAGMLDGAVTVNLELYVLHIQQAAKHRKLLHLFERATQNPAETSALLPLIKVALEDSAATGFSSSVAVVRMLSDVEAKQVDWLNGWEPYIPKSMLTMVTGDPGVGKSYAALAISADLSRRGSKTVYLTVENSAAHTLRPRFDSLKGDASKLILLEGISSQGITRSVTLQDVEVLDKTLSEHKPELVVIDPIQSYLGAGVDAHRSNETRPILDGLAKLAEKHHVAVLILRHASKNGSGRAIFRGLGSIDFTGAVRSELYAGETLEKQRALCHIKSNIGPLGAAQGYDITPADEQGRVWSAGYFRWTGDTQIVVADLTEPEEANGGPSVGAEAENFLREILGAGPMSAKAVLKEARDAGISQRTLDRAKSKLRVESRKGGYGWEWVLPPEKASRAPNTKVGTLEPVEPPKQHTINNIGKDAKGAKGATLRGVGTLDGGLEISPGKPSFGCPDCGARFDSSVGWAKHSVDGCGRA